MRNYHPLMRFVIPMLVAFSIIAVTGAKADTGDYNNYVRVGLGANQPTGDLDSAGYDTGLNGGVAYGRYLENNLVLEGGVTSFFADQDITGTTTLTGNYTREDILSTSAIMGTIKGELPVGRMTLFAGAGAGIYIVVLDSEIDTTRRGDLDAEDSDSVFGAHVVVGGNFDITHRVFLGFEGLYRWTTEYDLNDTVGTIPVALKGDLDGYAITFTGGFRF